MIQDAFLSVRIDAGKSVIENENPRIANDGARDRGPLLLSTRER